MYTNSWFDIDKEGAAAEALIANGAVIIGQHADSTGAPAATQKLKDSGKICYSVGYNIDMLATAPTAALTSATNVWKVYYKELFEGAQAGSIPQDWCKGYEDGAVAITDLGPECADGTAEKVAEVEAALKDGSLHVFDTSKFTVGGETVTTAPVDLTYYDTAPVLPLLFTRARPRRLSPTVTSMRASCAQPPLSPCALTASSKMLTLLPDR